MIVGFLIPGSLLTTRAIVVKERKTSYTIQLIKEGPSWSAGSYRKVPKENFKIVNLKEEIYKCSIHNFEISIANSFWNSLHLFGNAYLNLESKILRFMRSIFQENKDLLTLLDNVPLNKETLLIESDRLMEEKDERGILLSSFLHEMEEIYWIPELLQMVETLHISRRNVSDFETIEYSILEIISELNSKNKDIGLVTSQTGPETITFTSLPSDHAGYSPPTISISESERPKKKKDMPKHVPKKARRRGREWT